MTKSTKIFALFAFTFASSALIAEDGFIEGFPDIPKLEIVSEIAGDPVVFDTPSGTVAEATLLTSNKGTEALNAYKTALSALGWSCKRPPQSLKCTRGGNTVTFLNDIPQAETGRIILRLAPTK
ncbi:hypothetical protein KFE96_18210 [Kordiimonas sp. SCSIO 12603]|uniref:hypothetical protein n=1 Tax=Kordiimonas sp. SCSIO 12603 TaxID=2829596 RepID=UPI002106103A|nr:hypothetical protein [Kordiimonas sp. SCSIO 12603]UTW58721.1 hypothetical protein KFE96_18210 [Kordiimonas sp. SCSIO 12603]